MGCGASTPVAVRDVDIGTRERQLKARFTPTYVPRDSSDTSVLLKVLEQAQGGVFKRRAPGSNGTGSGEASSFVSALDSFDSDDGLSSKRMQRFGNANLLASRRGNISGDSSAGGASSDTGRSGSARPQFRSSLAAPAPPSASPGRSPPVTPSGGGSNLTASSSGSRGRGSSGSGGGRQAQQPAGATVLAPGTPSVDGLFTEYGFSGKSVVARLTRHPIGLLHYWTFLHYLDLESAAAVCSLNALTAVASAAAPPMTAAQARAGGRTAANGYNSQGSLGTGVPGATAEDAPYEVLLLLYLQLDKLFRFGTIPPVTRNPFGRIVHVEYNDAASADEAAAQAQANSNSANGSGKATTAAAVAADPAADKQQKERTMHLQFMRDQYYKQFAAIRSHRVFYQTLAETAERIQTSFCGGSQAAGSCTLMSHPQYAPNASLRALTRVLPSECVGDLARSLVYYSNATKEILAAVTAIEREHRDTVAEIDTAVAAAVAAGADVGAALAKFRFSAVASDTFYELELEGRAHTDLNPLARFSFGGVRDSTAGGDPAASAAALAAAATAAAAGVVGKHGRRVDCTQSRLLRQGAAANPRAYAFLALVNAPKAPYIPDLGVLFARERVLEVLSEHTIAPFLRSTLYKGLASTLITACAARRGTGSDASARGASASAAHGSSSNLAAANRTMLPLSAAVPQSAAALMSPPPQLILLETMKAAGYAAWLGYAPGPMLFTAAVAASASSARGSQSVKDANATTTAMVMSGLGAGVVVPGASNTMPLSPRGTGSFSATGGPRAIVLREAGSGGSGSNANHNQVARDEAKSFPHGPKLPPLAYDLSKVTVAREALKSYCHAVPMLPHNVGVCVISLLAESPNHEAFWQYKRAMYAHQQHIAANLPRGSAPWTPTAPVPPTMEPPNTLRVVYCNAEFAALSGGLAQYANSAGGASAAAAAAAASDGGHHNNVANSSAASIMASIAAQVRRLFARISKISPNF